MHRWLPGQRRAARGRRPAVPGGAGFCRLRLLPLSRGRFRPDVVRDGMDEAPPPGRVRLRPPEQPADGLLSPELAGRGPEASWDEGAARRRQPLRRALLSPALRLAACDAYRLPVG